MRPASYNCVALVSVTSLRNTKNFMNSISYTFCNACEAQKKNKFKGNVHCKIKVSKKIYLPATFSLMLKFNKFLLFRWSKACLEESAMLALIKEHTPLQIL